MNARHLLNALRDAGVVLTPEDDGLHVDAPAGVLTEALRSSLVENKETLIELLERERIRLGAAARRGLIIRWSEYPVWIELHNPLTGEWHEVRASECLPGVVDTANRKRNRKANRKEPNRYGPSRTEQRHSELKRRSERRSEHAGR
jgi:tubulysin polyketide synthase-like protein